MWKLNKCGLRWNNMLLSILEILISTSLILLLGAVICVFAFFIFEIIQDIKDEISRKRK
jgi:hypothetical protein